MDERLSAEPDVWTEAEGFRQRWTPGAFGERATITDVLRFKVIEEEWSEDDEGNVWRTIHRAEVIP